MMVRRERPSLVFDASGEPAVLLTAVCPHTSYRFCFTTANSVVNSQLPPPSLADQGTWGSA